MGQAPTTFRPIYDRVGDDDTEDDFPLNRPTKESTPLNIFSSQSEASLFSGIGNLSNTILGSGMLGLPFAMASSGVVVGAILFLVASMATMFGLHLLAISAEITTPTAMSSYFGLAKMTFPKAAILADLALIIKCFGVSLSYLIVFGALMPDSMKAFSSIPPDSIVLERSFWVPMSAILCVPLCFLKTLNALRFTSYIALLSVVYVFGLVVYYFITKSSGVSWEKINLFPTTVEHFFSNIPIFVFAFTCHQNLLPIRNEMIGKPERVSTIIICSVLITLSVYVLIGYCGYFTFGGLIKDNIINNLPHEDVVVVCRFAVSILVAFSYPLQIHPCRNSLLNLARAVTSKAENPIAFYGITLFICLASYSVAFFFSDLGIVFSIVGATGSVTICYILPGLYYVRLTWEENWHLKKVFAMALVCGGLLLMVNSLIWIVLRELNKEDDILIP